MPTPDAQEANSDSGRVPVFGTWRTIYACVIVVNVLAMAAVYFFSRFDY